MISDFFWPKNNTIEKEADVEISIFHQQTNENLRRTKASYAIDTDQCRYHRMLHAHANAFSQFEITENGLSSVLVQEVVYI